VTNTWHVVPFLSVTKKKRFKQLTPGHHRPQEEQVAVQESRQRTRRTQNYSAGDYKDDSVIKIDKALGGPQADC
jgi:hypothetical protein